MALQERIFSLETEYGINFYLDGDGKAPDPKVQVKSLQEVLVERYGLAGSDFLANGSKFHHDVGHAEWSLPECRSAREASVYDKAADHLLAMIIPQAQQRLVRQGFRGTLFVFKNNVDSVGHTFGCHENYLMVRDTDVLGGEAFLRYIVRCLVPFLVTRQIFCGAGRLILSPLGPDQPPVFQISQRADFIETIVSKETRSERAIVNLSREEEPLAAGNCRRLHLILGDSNLSGWATWMKLGTTGIVLRMIEDLFIGDIPLLADPVGALRQISHDPTCRAPIPLRDGRTMSAIDIQWHYYDLAEEYLDGFGFSEEEEAILEAWGQALEDLEQDPMRLRDRADWVIKKRLMDAFLERLGGSWEHWPGGQEALSGLLGIELRYHDVSQEGLFSRLWKPDTLVAEEEIQQAQNDPPLYTRARIRGRAIALHSDLPVTLEKWTALSIGGEEVELTDPLEFSHPLLPEALKDLDDQWPNVLHHPSPHIRIRAVTYLGWQNTETALAALAQIAQTDPDERVRRTAVEVLGKIGNEQAVDALIRCLRDPERVVRWAAEEALERSARGKAEAPPAGAPVSPPDTGEHLVQMIS